MFFQLESKDNIIDMARLANKVRNDRFYEQVIENITEIDLMFDSPKLDINAYYIKLLNKLSRYQPITFTNTNIMFYNGVCIYKKCFLSIRFWNTYEYNCWKYRINSVNNVVSCNIATLVLCFIAS